MTRRPGNKFHSAGPSGSASLVSDIRYDWVPVLVATLIGDLKAAGLLDQMLIVALGEFGRTAGAPNGLQKAPLPDGRGPEAITSL